MATANVLSIKNQGLVAYDGTATFNGRTLSATSSKVSISNGNGVSGNPSVDVVEGNLTLNNIGGTLGVSKGGTGATTLTNNSLLLGSGTSAVSGLGAATNGQIPIGSTGNAPVLATITAGSGVTITNGAGSIQIDSVGSAANANAILDESDDFIYMVSTGSSNQEIGPWFVEESGITGGVSSPFTYQEAGRPGIIPLTSGGSPPNVILLSKATGVVGFNNGNILIGGGVITLQWFVKLSALSALGQRYLVRLGLTINDNAITDPDYGLWFEYSDNVNSGNWQIKAAEAGTSTIANTSTAATTNWTVYKIVINAAGTSVAYYINGTEVANSPITTNLPARVLIPQVQLYKSTGVNNVACLVDLYTLQQVLTTAR